MRALDRGMRKHFEAFIPEDTTSATERTTFAKRDAFYDLYPRQDSARWETSEAFWKDKTIGGFTVRRPERAPEIVLRKSHRMPGGVWPRPGKALRIGAHEAAHAYASAEFEALAKRLGPRAVRTLVEQGAEYVVGDFLGRRTRLGASDDTRARRELMKLIERVGREIFLQGYFGGNATSLAKIEAAAGRAGLREPAVAETDDGVDVWHAHGDMVEGDGAEDRSPASLDGREDGVVTVPWKTADGRQMERSATIFHAPETDSILDERGALVHMRTPPRVTLHVSAESDHPEIILHAEYRKTGIHGLQVAVTGIGEAYFDAWNGEIPARSEDWDQREIEIGNNADIANLSNLLKSLLTACPEIKNIDRLAFTDAMSIDGTEIHLLNAVLGQGWEIAVGDDGSRAYLSRHYRGPLLEQLLPDALRMQGYEEAVSSPRDSRHSNRPLGIGYEKLYSVDSATESIEASCILDGEYAIPEDLDTISPLKSHWKQIGKSLMSWCLTVRRARSFPAKSIRRMFPNRSAFAQVGKMVEFYWRVISIRPHRAPRGKLDRTGTTLPPILEPGSMRWIWKSCRPSPGKRWSS
jgi:hypothetical protein